MTVAAQMRALAPGWVPLLALWPIVAAGIAAALAEAVALMVAVGPRDDGAGRGLIPAVLARRATCGRTVLRWSAGLIPVALLLGVEVATTPLMARPGRDVLVVVVALLAIELVARRWHTGRPQPVPAAGATLAETAAPGVPPAQPPRGRVGAGIIAGLAVGLASLLLLVHGARIGGRAGFDAQARVYWDLALAPRQVVADDLVALADGELATGRAGRAVVALEASLALRPSMLTRALLAGAYAAAGRCDEAQASYREASRYGELIDGATQEQVSVLLSRCGPSGRAPGVGR